MIVKRSDHDRREQDIGPPEGWKKDRRIRPDRRALEIIEVEETSFNEFVAWKLRQLRTGTR